MATSPDCVTARERDKNARLASIVWTIADYMRGSGSNVNQFTFVLRGTSA